MDRMFQRIMRGLVETGPRAALCRARARPSGMSIEEGRLILHDVMQAYPIGWLHPETDYIVVVPQPLKQSCQIAVSDQRPRRAAMVCASAVFEAIPPSPGFFRARTVRIDGPLSSTAATP